MSTDYKKLYDDLFASGYHDGDFTHSKVFFKDIEKFIANIQNPKILDVGCATGNAVSYFQKQNIECYGVDISEVAISKCKGKKLDNCFPYPANDLRFDKDLFDVVFSTEVLEHLATELSDRAISEIHRVCKTNGRVYLRIHLAREKNREYDKITSMHNLQDLHVNIKTEEDWLKTLDQYFTKVEKRMDNKGSFYFIGDKKI